MTDYNYKLIYNGNLRWTDYRSPNHAVDIGVEVRLDVVTFDNNSSTMLHIHNYHTRCIAEDDKHVKATYSCFVGVGRIIHEIFGQMGTIDNPTEADSFLVSDPGLWVVFNSEARLIHLVSSLSAISGAMNIFVKRNFCHFVPLVDTKTLPLVLAIPLNQIGVK